jgi:thiamine-phosphate pyrophosphorylase
MAMSVDTTSRARRKLKAAARRASRALPPALPPVLFLTDPVRTPDPEAIVAGLPAGWGVIYRHFGAPDRREVAQRLAGLCRKRRLVFLVAADPALAAAVHADGVHWPFRQREEAVRWRSRFRLQTVSAHSARELRIAAASPVSAVIVSTVFASSSPSAGRPIGPLRWARLARLGTPPVYGLGGVTYETAGQVAQWGGLSAVEGLRAFARIRT